jgi:hypothetical protein
MTAVLHPAGRQQLLMGHEGIGCSYTTASDEGAAASLHVNMKILV